MFFQTQNLCFSYYRSPLCLKDINFSINKGQKVVCFASKDMGKTTFLKILSSFESSYFGNILLNGKELKSIEDKNKKFSLILSDPIFEKQKTIKQNLDYFCEVNNLNYLLNDEIAEILKQYNIKKSINDKIKNLSLFEKRKLAIARSLLKNPQIMFLDNQFDGLNDIEQKEMFVIYEKLNKCKELTIIYTLGEKYFNSFSQKQTLKFDKIYYLCDAILREYKTIDEFIENRDNLNIFNFLTEYNMFDIELCFEDNKYKFIDKEDNVVILNFDIYKNFKCLKLENYDICECVIVVKNKDNDKNYTLDGFVEKLNSGQAFLYSKLCGDKLI